MSRVGTDEAREHRIHMEIIVDCYGEDDGETQEALEDWLYWTKRGYRF